MRSLLLSVLGLGLLALAACTSASGSSSVAGSGSTRPNVVMVLTDDLSWNLVSHMPHVQQLEKAGTTFPHYDVVDSLCCPSRSAIFTGEYPHDDGVFTNSGRDGGYNAYQRHQDQQNSFAVSLQKNGYATAMMGKYLNGYQPTDPVPAGWSTWDVAGNGYPEFNYDLNENGTVHHYGKDPKDYLVDVLSGKADQFVSSTSKPFMLEVATFAPHAPYTPAPRYANAAKNVAYPRTPAYDTTPTDPPSWLKNDPALTAAQEQDLQGAYDKRVEADLAVDDLVGHLESTLKAAGKLDDTYIVFSSDNGYHMGEYRLLSGKQTAFDTDINVPLIVSGPGVPAGRTDQHFATNIDLAPTFESLTGSTVPSKTDGVSLAGLWHGSDPAHWQQGVLIEHHGPDDTKGDPDRQNRRHADPPSYEAVRTADALYVKYANGEQEYYDTARDPYELHNIAAQGVPSALPQMLTALRTCHGASACQHAAGA
jgi:N-acetylglucosamine-6-sulfatase